MSQGQTSSSSLYSTIPDSTSGQHYMPQPQYSMPQKMKSPQYQSPQYQSPQYQYMVQSPPTIVQSPPTMVMMEPKVVEKPVYIDRVIRVFG